MMYVKMLFRKTIKRISSIKKSFHIYTVFVCMCVCIGEPFVYDVCNFPFAEFIAEDGEHLGPFAALVAQLLEDHGQVAGYHTHIPYISIFDYIYIEHTCIQAWIHSCIDTYHVHTMYIHTYIHT